MTQEVVVTRRGQTTIPQEIRKKLDIREGTRLLVDAEGGKVVFRRLLDKMREER
jgi:AbrB family looped-hinge helix DNA binding protein